MKTATHRAPSPIATIVAALAAAVTLAACAGPHVELTSQRPALDDDSPLPSAIETHTCYVGVGPDASDAHVDPYDRAAPFATVAAALARGRADCGVIVLLDGTYAQRIVIIGNRPAPGEGWLTIAADHPFHDLTAPAGDSSTGPPGSAWPTGAVIDGGLAPVDGRLARQAAVAIYDSSYVRIDGLRVRDDANKYCTAYPPSSSQCNNAGIDVRDVPGGSGPSSHHVEIRGNEISGVVAARLATGGTLAAPTACTGDPRACTRKYDSTSLAVYAGRGDAAGATHHVALVDNVVHDCDPNSDHNGVPLVLVSTNVEDVLVQGNAILGGLASAALPGYPGLTVRGERFGVSADPTLDRARRVVIRRNLFAELGGPAVSVQSANNVLVERNVASATGYGFQVTTEGDQAHGTGPQEVTWAHQIWIRANLVVDADVWAIDAGQVSSGYSYVHDVYVTNNTIVASEHLRPSPVGARDAMVFREGVTGDSVFANNLVYLGLAGDEGCQWDSAYTG